MLFLLAVSCSFVSLPAVGCSCVPPAVSCFFVRFVLPPPKLLPVLDAIIFGISGIPNWKSSGCVSSLKDGIAGNVFATCPVLSLKADFAGSACLKVGGPVGCMEMNRSSMAFDSLLIGP